MFGYTLAAIGAGIIVALGVPFMERLLKRVRSMTPTQEQAEFFRARARRSIDRFPH
jgi:hypothetical protein